MSKIYPFKSLRCDGRLDIDLADLVNIQYRDILIFWTNICLTILVEFCRILETTPVRSREGGSESSFTTIWTWARRSSWTGSSNTSTPRRQMTLIWRSGLSDGMSSLKAAYISIFHHITIIDKVGVLVTTLSIWSD